MRSLGCCAVTLVAMFAALPAQADWCAVYQSGGRNCYFKTEAQCRASISGAGGACFPDGSSAAPARQAKPPQRTEPRRQETARPKPAAPKPAAAPAAAPPPAAAVPAPAAPAPAAAAAPAAGGATANFAAARKLVLDGQYQAGLAALQALGFDDHPDVATYIGLAHNKLGRPDQARVWYERALAASPNHLLTLSFSGLLYAERGDLKRAQDNLEKLKQLCGGTCNEYRALDAVLAAKPR
jgi:tetratricopeptide (TPR) repeat protein